MAKVIQTRNLSSLNGVKDVTFGKASVEARRKGDFSKTGKSSRKKDESYDDTLARQKEYGFIF
jgi:hypothetical protein